MVINVCVLVGLLTLKSLALDAVWLLYTVKMNMLYLINKIVASDYKQYYLLN